MLNNVDSFEMVYMCIRYSIPYTLRDSHQSKHFMQTTRHANDHQKYTTCLCVGYFI